jgi:hypothetical protein
MKEGRKEGKNESPQEERILIDYPAESGGRFIESELMSLWNSIPEFQNIREFTKERKVALRARLKEPLWRDTWKECVMRMASDDFCTGRCPPRKPGDQPFRANIDWFLRPGTLIQQMEKMDGKAKPASNGSEPMRRRNTEDDFINHNLRLDP